MRRNNLFAAALFLVVSAIIGRDGGAAEKTAAVANAPSAQSSVQEKLNQRIDFDVVEMPLKDVVQHLQRETGIQIFLQLKKLEEASVSADTPVTKSFKQVRLCTLLELMLKDLELTYIEKDELLLVTTPEDAEANMVIRVYDCRDLLAMTLPPGADKVVFPTSGVVKPSENTGIMGCGSVRREYPRPVSEHDLRVMRLLYLIETNVDVASWNAVGGPGEISEFNGLMVVTQTARTHEKVERLLDMLRQAAGLEIGKAVRVVR